MNRKRNAFDAQLRGVTSDWKKSKKAGKKKGEGPGTLAPILYMRKKK